MMYLCLIVATASTLTGDDPVRYGGATLPQWQTRLGQLDPTDPGNAAAVPALIAIIDDERLSSEVRRPFAMMLGRMGAISRDAIPVLVEKLERRDPSGEPTYAWAARALGLYGVHARSAVPALVDLLFDERFPQHYRTLSIEALARIGTDHHDVMPALIRLLQYRGEDPEKVTPAQASVYRELAAEALSVMGPDAEMAAPLLIRCVRNPQETDAVRRKAIVALGAIGPRAALAIPALVEVLELSQDETLRTGASEALGKIGPPALPMLQRYLQHPDAATRRYAARSIALMGKQAQPAVRTLIAALNDPDPPVRVTICESLYTTTAAPDAYIPQLIELLTCDDRQVRVRAMRLLIKLGQLVQPHLDQLRQLESHSSAATRSVVRRTLRELSR